MLALGPKYVESIPVLRTLAFLPFVITLSNVFGTQTMLTFGMNKLFSRIVISAAIVNVVLIVPLVYLMKAEGAAIAALVSEVLVTALMAAALKKHGLILLRKKGGPK
jgi:PST family polysaccharide transporter